jgi:hypothetical protein
VLGRAVTIQLQGKRDWAVVVGFATLVAAVLALLPGYFIFWHRSDVVFDQRALEIPLSEPLRKTIESALALASNGTDCVSVSRNGQPVTDTCALPGTKLPDKLLYVNVRNVGKIPSALIRVRVSVPGVIADKDVGGAGPVMGDVTQLKVGSDSIYFECPNLADEPHASLRIAIWYQQTGPGSPSVQVLESSEGPAREVGSVDTAGFYLLSLGDRHPFLAGVLAFLPSFLGFCFGLFVLSKQAFRLGLRSGQKAS